MLQHHPLILPHAGRLSSAPLSQRVWCAERTCSGGTEGQTERLDLIKYCLIKHFLQASRSTSSCSQVLGDQQWESREPQSGT